MSKNSHGAGVFSHVANVPPSQLPVRVLLVEDNEGDIYLLAKALAEADFSHTLTVLKDGAQAMQLLAAEAPDGSDSLPQLLLLDLNLPCVDGGEIIDMLRSRPVLEDIPVVLLSSSQAPHDRAKAKQLRYGIYVTKPSKLEAFLAIGQEVKDFWARSQHPRLQQSPQ